MAAVTEGLKSGILSSNLVLAEQVFPGDGGAIIPLIWLSASVAAVVEFQHRNAANNATLWAHRFFVGATNPFSPATSEDAGVAVASGERFRLVLITGLIGDVQGTMIF